MTCLVSLLQNARVEDPEGNEIGEVVGFNIMFGKMVVTVTADDFEEVDPDGGTKVDPDEVQEPKLRAVQGGKK